MQFKSLKFPLVLNVNLVKPHNSAGRSLGHRELLVMKYPDYMGHRTIRRGIHAHSMVQSPS